MESNTSNGTMKEKRNRIQVSNTKRPLFFYVNLAKRHLKQHGKVELSALGMAIPTVVIIAEILKREGGAASNQKVQTSTVSSKDRSSGRFIHKPRIEMVVGKTVNSVI